MKTPTSKQQIIDILKEKSCLKQSIFSKTIDVFDKFKSEAEILVKELSLVIAKHDKKVVVEYQLKGDYEFHIKFGGDILVFFMHTNVFDFPKNHIIWQNSYVKDNRWNAYCGMINVYNFLADSFKYNRVNDVGYLVARCFINNDLHYFVEGKKRLGLLFNDFANEKIDNANIRSVIESTILYALDFDLLTPPYSSMSEVRVIDVIETTNAMNLKTAKRLGFKFQSDTDNFK
ncbi:MAG: hypothetical protein IT232_05850 [Flavobacteriales bacterium]|nr:hypothetical protein [Flavobacteriales bacterium]